MKKRTILYYPTINIPTKSWLRHSLLYWDEVSSIVPQSWNGNYLHKLSPDINYLIDEGQFRPISPNELITKADNWDKLSEFENELIDVYESTQFKNFMQRQPFRQSRIHIDKVNSQLLSRIHQNKTSGNLYHFLKEHGLAKQDRSNDEWFLFENHAALIYMSVLAKYLAEVDNNHTTIGTDYSVYEKFNFKRVNNAEAFPVVNLNLVNILPSPTPNVPLEKIIDFKKERKDELVYFRKILMDLQNKISKAKSQQELNDIAVSFQENMKVGIKTLRATFKDYRMEFISKTLKSLIGIKSPSTWFAAASVADQYYPFLNNEPISIPIKVGTTLLAGAVEVYSNYIEVRNKMFAKTRDSSFSYLLQAQRAKILQPFE
jgi:hypothetical protein